MRLLHRALRQAWYCFFMTWPLSYYFPLWWKIVVSVSTNELIVIVLCGCCQNQDFFLSHCKYETMHNEGNNLQCSWINVLDFCSFFFKFNQLQCNWKKSVKKTDYPKTLPTETVILAYIVFVCFVSLMFVCICVLYSRLYEHHLFLLIIIKMVLNSAILCDSFHVFSSQNQQMVKQCSYINNSCPSACWEVVNGKTFSRVGLFDKKKYYFRSSWFAV